MTSSDLKILIQEGTTLEFKLLGKLPRKLPGKLF